MIKGIVKYLLSFFGLEYRRGTSILLNKLSSYGIPSAEWEQHRGMYHLKVIDVLVKDVKSPLIVQYNIAKSIFKDGGGRFFYDDDHRLRLSIQNVNFFINFPDELYVINEVFVSGDYNFRTTDEIVVIDIGFNIGATSLFFARERNVKRVYSYELFEPTFEAAKRNLSLNDATKIVSQNVGLGKDTRQLRIPYSPSNKARMGLNGLPSSEEFPDAIDVTVSVKDVAEEFVRINHLESGLKKICKMDCEGAEFEILERLFQKGVANLIDVYIIEWHSKEGQNIEDQFLKNGFDVIKPTLGNTQTGLLYAFKK